MSANNTHDFDVLVQISESELNKQLKAIFLSCDGGIPRGFDDLPIPGYINFDTPTIRLVETAGKVNITVPISNSQIKLPGENKTQLDGSIVITHKIEAFENSNSASIGLDFQSSDFKKENLEIKLDQLDVVWKDAFRNVAHNQLSSIGRINFTEIPLRQQASDTFMPLKVEVTTVNSREGNCLTIALKMANDDGRVGEISQINAYLIPNDHSAAIIISSYWLLAHILRSKVAQELGVTLDHFDKPLKLNQPIPSLQDDDDLTLTEFDAKIVGEYIHISGHIAVSNPGPDQTVDFSIDVNFHIDENGKLQPTTKNYHSNFSLLAEFIDWYNDGEKDQELQNTLEDIASKSYSLGALAQGFKILSAQIENNLVLSADVISDDMPEDFPHISIQSTWIEAESTMPINVFGRHHRDVIWHGEFEASFCRADFPIKCDWYINGEALEEGENHQINIPTGSLTYDFDLDNQVLSLKTTRTGQSITGELCVKAVDGLNQPFSACIDINKGGTVSSGDSILNHQIPPDIMREWVNPIPIDPMLQGKIDPGFVAKIDPDIVTRLMGNENVKTLIGLRTRLELTQTQMAKRVGLSLSDYAKFEKGKRQR